MNGDVAFPEEQGTIYERPKEQRGLAEALVRMHITRSTLSANALISFMAFMFFATAVYIVLAGPLTPEIQGELPSLQIILGKR